MNLIMSFIIDTDGNAWVNQEDLIEALNIRAAQWVGMAPDKGIEYIAAARGLGTFAEEVQQAFDDSQFVNVDVPDSPAGLFDLPFIDDPLPAPPHDLFPWEPPPTRHRIWTLFWRGYIEL